MERERHLEHYFERPMLNSRAEGNTIEAEFLVRRVKARLDASRQSNQILVDYMYNQFSPVRHNSFQNWYRLMAIWQNLQERYGTF